MSNIHKKKLIRFLRNERELSKLERIDAIKSRDKKKVRYQQGKESIIEKVLKAIDFGKFEEGK